MNTGPRSRRRVGPWGDLDFGAEWLSIEYMEEIGKDPIIESPEPTIGDPYSLSRPLNRINQRSPTGSEETTEAPTRGVLTLVGLVVLASSLLALSLNEAFGYINVAVGCLLALGGLANPNLLRK